MDETFQDSLTLNELFKPSILKLDDIFMPYSANFGNEFNEERKSKNIHSNQTHDECNLNQSINFLYSNSPSENYKSASSQYSDLQDGLNENISPQNISNQSNSKFSEENEQNHQQKQENNAKCDLSFDNFVEIFGPSVLESLGNIPPDLFQSLLNEMYHQILKQS